MNLIRYLKSPYPMLESKWKTTLLISFFVSLFLYIFQPFGLSFFDSPKKMAIIFGYGGVTFVVLLIDLFFVESIFPSYFSEKNWTIIRQITTLLGVLFTIGLGNYFYSILVISGIHPGWKVLIIFQVITLLVGLFPIIFITLVSHNAYLRKHGRLAGELEGRSQNKSSDDEQAQKISIFNESGSEKLFLGAADFLYAESAGNYVTIKWKGKDSIKKCTLRSTLYEIKNQLSDYPPIVQCHRAYLINTEQVVRVKGNAQGYRLSLQQVQESIPVSRSYIPEFNRVFRT